MHVYRSMLATAATVTAVVLIAGCGDDSSGGASASAPPQTTPASSSTTESSVTPSLSPTPTPTEEIREIAVTIADGEITPPPDRIEVDEGTTVRIVVTSDAPDEVHVHGYELEASVGPGETATIEFVADQTGLFEVETHELDKVLFQLQVQ